MAALRKVYPTKLKAFFLGYVDISPTQKLDEIRLHAGHPNDWSHEYSDAALLAIIQREITFSHYLQTECAQYEFPYYDMSHQFMEKLDEIVASVRTAS